MRAGPSDLGAPPRQDQEKGEATYGEQLVQELEQEQPWEASMLAEAVRGRNVYFVP